MTLQIRPRARRHGIASRLAPHVAPGWADEFVLELRLRGVVGPRIGDALSEVESHCAESDETAHEAFGDPVDYARSLDLPAGVDTSPRALLRAVGPTALGVLGALVLLWGFAAWHDGGRLEVTTGHLVTVVLYLLGVAALVRFADPVLRGVVHHPVLGWLVLMAVMAVMAVAFALDGTGIWGIDVGWVVATGSTALVSSVALALVRRRAARTPDGPITSPLGTAARPTGGVSRGEFGNR